MVVTFSIVVVLVVASIVRKELVSEPVSSFHDTYQQQSYEHSMAPNVKSTIHRKREGVTTG
jgi:hypothetical protein